MIEHPCNDAYPEPDAPDEESRTFALGWLRQVFSHSESGRSSGQERTATPPPVPVEAAAQPTRAITPAKELLAEALVAAIRGLSTEADRDEVLRWFLNARQVLARDGPMSETARMLYGLVETKRLAQLIGNMAVKTVRNYKDSKLPLSIKVAIPITAVGTAVFGLQGAGLAAFGGAIGVPVVLLLFLGVAGVTSIVEAFVKDKSVRDPLTKLLLGLVVLETARRVGKDLLDALRAEVMVPQRADVTRESDEALLEQLLAMDPTTFERHVMSFFEGEGHLVALTQKSNDFGVDGYIVLPDGIIIVQCKRYALDNPVGRPTVQQFKGVIEEQNALKGYIVTTSRFTQQAVESAAQSKRIVLVDGYELLRWHKGLHVGVVA